MHLGLGNLLWAHQAWYSEHAGDAGGWGYAAFAGRGADLAGKLNAQDGLHTLLERGARRDSAEIVASVSAAYPGAGHAGWLAARRAGGGGPLALVPCDNVAGNGALAGPVVADAAGLVDPALAEGIAESLAVVTTVVDRITPRSSRAEIGAAARATGRARPGTGWR